MNMEYDKRLTYIIDLTEQALELMDVAQKDLYSAERRLYTATVTFKKGEIFSNQLNQIYRDVEDHQNETEELHNDIMNIIKKMKKYL